MYIFGDLNSKDFMKYRNVLVCLILLGSALLNGCTLLGMSLALFTPASGTVKSPSLIANGAEYDAEIINRIKGVQSTARCADLYGEEKAMCKRRAAAIARSIEKHQSKN